MPLRHRHDYAAVLHRGLPVSDINRPKSSLRRRTQMRIAAQPISVRLELVVFA